MGFDPNRPTRTLAERFWVKVRKGGGCWEWVGYVEKRSGYGRIMLDSQSGKLISAHKASHLINVGPIRNGAVVRHMCHNKTCVRPDHLRLGSAAQNVQDKMRAKRQACGERQHLAKLTWEYVDQIFRYRDKGRSTYWIARQFEVSRPTICAILNGKTWNNRNGVNRTKAPGPIRVVRDTQTPEQRFWSHVRKTRYCWEWVGSLNNKGYGWFRANGKTYTAHRWIYIFENGPIGDLIVMHTCDNPKCVRPSHLKSGTMKDNTQDMIKKGRSKFRQYQPKGRREDIALKKGDGCRLRSETVS